MRLIFIYLGCFILPSLLAACAEVKSSGSLRLTPSIYYKPTIYQNQSKCSPNSLRELISPDGDTMVTLCESDYKMCLLQGSCFVDDGEKITSYNYHSKQEGLPRFIVVDTKKCPYGYGVRNICLDPYFSVAADLSFYNPGDAIFIPRLVGAVLPNGEIHDGFVVIRDAGGGITGAGRFDFFTGFLSHRKAENVLAKLGFGDPANSFEFRRATAAESQAARERRSFPSLKE